MSQKTYNAGPVFPAPRRNEGMTLVELLVVIVVIAVLFAILMPAIGRLRERAHEVDAEAAMKTLRDAIVQYHFEYGVWPLDYDLHAGAIRTGDVITFTDDNYRVLAYLDVDHSDNKKEILFLQQSRATGARPRFDDFIQDDQGNIVDRRENPFTIEFDTGKHLVRVYIDES